ncbi:MAG: rod shape-determining protein RodA [Sphingomonadaceae bacterium]
MTDLAARRAGSLGLAQKVLRLNWALILLIIAIAGTGFLMLYSVAGGSLTPWALNQAVRFAAFFAMALTMSYIPVARYKDLAFPAYGAVLVLLFAVEAIGRMGGGAQRWLNLGFITLQPSELMKPVLIVALARFYELLPLAEMRRWIAIWPALFLIMVPVALIVVQPDLGTAVTVLAGGLVMMFLAGLPLRYFFGGAALLAAAIPLAYNFILHDYQRRRVAIFLNPEADPLGAGYHLSQSKIAIGSGGIFGKGFLKGTQSNLDYLPEGHTDFVFASMAEEWGLMGGIALIFAFALLLRWGMRVALRARDRFSRLAAAGLTVTIFLYFAVNLLMVMGLAPVVGIPLPLVSYGGSAMLTIMLCIGVLMAIHRDNEADARRRRW